MWSSVNGQLTIRHVNIKEVEPGESRVLSVLEDLDVSDSHSILAERTQPSAESLRENILLKTTSSLIMKGTSIYPANLASNPGVTGSPSPAWDQFPYLMIHSFI